MSNPPPGYGGPPPSPYAAPQSPAKSSGAPIVIILLVIFGGLFLVLLVCGGGMAALLLPAISAARDAAERVQHKNDLRQLGVAYTIYWDSQGGDAAPRSWEDLRNVSFLEDEVASRLRESGTTVVWGISQDAAFSSRLPSSQIILAYPSGPSPAHEPVAVLMADGSVMEVPYIEIERLLSAWQADRGP